MDTRARGMRRKVVTIAEKLPSDDLEDIKDNLDGAQNQQDNDKGTESRR